MRRFIIAISLLAALACGASLEAKSFYNTVRNSFGGLFPHPGMRMAGRYKAIEGEWLVEENATMAQALCCDTMKITSTAYRYQLRFANLNNKQGKSVQVNDQRTGKKTSIASTEWGLVFNRDDMGNCCTVTLNCENSSPYNDITDRRTMQVKLIQRQGTTASVIAQARVDKGVSLEDDMNTLSVEVDEKTVKVSIGKNELQQVLEAPVQRPSGPVQVGYLVGAGARVAIERAVLLIENENQVNANTPWTREALAEYLENSADPVEGYWTYLDRDMEDKWLRLGGRYTIATVRAGDGYDIIYIDGAQVKKSLWKTGMLKGHLTKTMFSGNYDGTWIDATLEPMDRDVQATIENAVILTMRFPVYNSQVRFGKVIDIDD